MTIPLQWLLLIGAMAFVFGTQRPAIAENFELFICHTPQEQDLPSWRYSTLSSIARTLGDGKQDLSFTIRRAVCNDTMPGASCAARPGAMFCRQSSIDRIGYAAAWLAQAHYRMGSPGYEQFRLNIPLAVLDAFRAADEDRADVVAENLIAGIQARAEARGRGESRATAKTEIIVLDKIYERILDYNFAALVGHEAAHMSEERCPIKTPSQIEKSGVFDRLIILQTGTELFCPKFPDANEMRADRCAVRYMNRLNASIIGATDDPQSPEVFARRVSADMIAFQAVVGWRRFSSLPQGVYVSPELNQYFRPAVRLLVLTAELGNLNARGSVCGEAAGLFVHSVQLEFTECPDSGGQVKDDILALLPRGVEASWNGEPWTPNSLNCFSSE